MLGAVVDVEDDRDLRIEAIHAERRKIRLSIKHQPISATRYGPIDEKKRLHAPVAVGPGMAQLRPAFVGVLYLKTNGHATCGRAARSVEYVRGDRAHGSWSGLWAPNVWRQYPTKSLFCKDLRSELIRVYPRLNSH